MYAFGLYCYVGQAFRFCFLTEYRTGSLVLGIKNPGITAKEFPETIGNRVNKNPSLFNDSAASVIRMKHEVEMVGHQTPGNGISSWMKQFFVKV